MKLATAVLSVFFSLCAAAQGGGPQGPFTAPRTSPTFLRDIFRNKEMQEKPSGSTEGSYFLSDSFLYGRIKARGREQTYDSVRIKLNIKTGQVHFLDENNEEMVVAVKVDAVMFIDASSPLNGRIYLSNFDQQPGFYEIMDEAGPLKLLKRLRLYVWETQPVNSEKIKHLEIQGDLYLCNGSMLYNSTKSCSAIRDAFAGNEKIMGYIEVNNLHCNREDDLRKIIRYAIAVMQ